MPMSPNRRLAMALDPVLLMGELGLAPDPWQASVVRSTGDRTLLLCARQTGKTTCTAILALHQLLFVPESLTLLVSPSLRQSGELFKRVRRGWHDLGRPIAASQETALTLTLENNSRVVSLPESPETIRGYSSVNCLIIDEAAMVADEMLTAVAPMLAVSGGRLIALSTPMGKRGWFHEKWTEGDPGWERVKVTASECPRIPAAFLEEQRRTIGERAYRQEYGCSFEETVDQVFSSESIDRAFRGDRRPMFEGVDFDES